MVSEIVEGFGRAFELILTLDPTVVDITFRSLAVSGMATILAASVGVPLGMAIGLIRFRGRVLVKAAFNALLGIPTTALGLILYLLLSRSGPLGFLRFLYRPQGIILGQSVLVAPIIVSFVVNSIEEVETGIRDLALTLGASGTQASMAVLREAMNGVLLAVTAAFNRAIAELGIAMMLGGNIRGLTRVLTTTIALETARGEIALGIAVAAILMLIVSVVSLSINLVKRRWR